MDNLAVGRIFNTKEDAKEAIHAAILKAGQSWAPGASPVGKRIPTQSNALAIKIRMTTPLTINFEFMLPAPTTMIGKFGYLGHTPVLHKRIKASHVENKLSTMSFPVILRLL